MKTLVIDGIFFQMNEWSGIAKYWRTLLVDLDEHLASRSDLTIYLLIRGESNSLRNHSFQAIRVLPIAFLDPICALSDFEELGRICNALSADAFISSYYTLAPGTANIGMAYDFIPEAMGFMENHIWKLKEIYMRSLQHCLSISKSTADAASYFYPNLSSGDADIFYPPMSNEECFQATRQSIRAWRLKYKINFPYASVVGHRGDYKNFDLLTRALRNRPLQHQKFAMGIVASAGEELTQDEILLYQQHFRFGIHRLKLNSDEMPIFLAGSELLFYPSLLEGFGYPVAEALLQCCPVVCTGATSINEILDYAEPSDYTLISGHDGHEALRAIASMLHSRRRSSANTAERLRQVFGRQNPERFIHRVLELAEQTSPPHLPDWSACLSLDGLLA